jgi:hypothetical protein
VGLTHKKRGAGSFVLHKKIGNEDTKAEKRNFEEKKRLIK